MDTFEFHENVSRQRFGHSKKAKVSRYIPDMDMDGGRARGGGDGGCKASVLVYTYIYIDR